MYYYVTNNIPDVYISFYTLHETAFILEKNGAKYILNRAENKKKSYSTSLSIYSDVLVAVVLKFFLVEDVLNT